MSRDYEYVYSAVTPFIVTHLRHPRTKLTELLAAVEQHVESGRCVLFWSGSAPRLADDVDRCKVVHTPVGIEAFVSESIVRERYTKVHFTYNRIRRVLASDCNEYLPFYRLHDDMIVEIWGYLNILDRHHAAQVSRRFRSVALNTAHLWTFVNFNNLPSVPRSDTVLERARSAPLHIRVNSHLRAKSPLLPPLLYGHPPPPPAIPFKPLSPPPAVIASIPRAAILDATVSRKDSFPPRPSLQYQVESGLKLEDLNMPMPLLRSLRLSMLPVMTAHLDTIRRASNQITEPLFGGYAPLLRHVALIQCSINWSDAAFRNLTYLLIKRPDPPFCVSSLTQILHTSPSLTYLGLESAIAPTEPEKAVVNVELLALQRLYITDKDSRRITSIWRRISAPNLLECDFTSADSAWFDPTTGSPPFSRLDATQEVTLAVTEHHTYRWVIQCRWGGKHAVRFHFDPKVMNYYVTAGMGYEDETAKLINTLRFSPICFERVRSLTLRGCFSITNLTHIFSLFPAIERLSTRHLCPPRIRGVGAGTTIFDTLSTTHSRHLQAIDVGTWPEPSPSSLLRWLSARSGGEGGCSKLTAVVVTSEKPLPSEARSSIFALLDKFLWRKSTVPNSNWHLPPVISTSVLPPVIPTSVAPPVTKITATQLAEDGSWDEDEEWARVPCPLDPFSPILPLNSLPLNSNLIAMDDPTLIYCDRALRRRWDYFAIPGM